MLQNISKELDYEEKAEKINKKEYFTIIKKIFTKQNIAVYILTTLISMVRIK